MDQMNVSITSQLASYVRKKVRSGRYNNASEVVREALRRMEDDDARVLRLAKPTAEDVLADLTEDQLDGILQRVRASRSEEHTSELQSRLHLVCRPPLDKKKHNVAQTYLISHLTLYNLLHTICSSLSIRAS